MHTRTGYGAFPVMAVMTGAQMGTSLIRSLGSLFGWAPRGELQKFQRLHYPYMRTLADRSGYNVYIFWFGDVVMVAPDGSYGVAIGVDELNTRLGSPIPPLAAYDLIPEIEDNFYYVVSNSSADPANTPQQDTFTLMYGGQQVSGEALEYAAQPPVTTPVTYPATWPETAPYEFPEAAYAGMIPTGAEYMTPLLVLGGIAALIAFSKPTRRHRK